ncbi:AAEL006600-PB [Aedes aegypti]|uniref:AAEL006600-PB n=1 Tax=Aedes aegypti TaxID=7159 RepID=Q175M3_AEDAE|nr:AAEL006600-PB [Aedes aegypti]
MVDPAALGLTEEDVELIVKRYLQEKRDRYNAKFRVLSYHVKRLSEEPIGYLGDHYFLNVVLREKMVHYSAEEEEYAEEEYLSFFLKILPEQVPKLADYVREMGCFRKEIQLYTHLIPRLQDVTIGTKPFAPRAYLTKDEKLLVFENLKAEGYRMLENNKSLLDFAHLEVALKTVAKLHAASLVLEERTKQSIMKLYSGHLNENVYIDDDTYVRKTNLDNAIKALCELIKRIDKYKNSDKLDFILAKFPEVIRRIYDFARPSTEYRNVFNHGDLWNNNLMFKYDEPETSAPNSDPVPVTAVLVDYQFSRLAPPAYDVMSLIMISTLSSFRNKHLEEWKNIYYDELGSLLAQQWCDSIDTFGNVEDLLPRAEFEESCREFHLAGLIESCMYFHWPPTPDCYEIANGADWFDESRKPEVFVRASLNGFERYDDYRHRISDMIMQIVDGYVLGDN